MKKSLVIWILSICLANSQEQVYGDWKVRPMSEFEVVFAVTVNDDESSAGAICLEEGCEAFVNLGPQCDDGEAYPYLVSFDDGIMHGEALCTVLGDNHLFSFGQDVLEKMMTSSKMGIAYGMADGTFKATYFSLSGSTKAIIEARRQINLLSGTQPRRGSVPLQ